MATRRKTKAEIEPHAIGDDAAAANMPIVAGATTAANTIDDEINLTRDLIAQRAKRTGVDIDIWVGPTAPAHKAGRIWIKTT